VTVFVPVKGFYLRMLLGHNNKDLFLFLRRINEHIGPYWWSDLHDKKMKFINFQISWIPRFWQPFRLYFIWSTVEFLVCRIYFSEISYLAGVFFSFRCPVLGAPCSLCTHSMTKVSSWLFPPNSELFFMSEHAMNPHEEYQFSQFVGFIMVTCLSQSP